MYLRIKKPNVAFSPGGIQTREGYATNVHYFISLFPLTLWLHDLFYQPQVMLQLILLQIYRNANSCAGTLHPRQWMLQHQVKYRYVIMLLVCLMTCKAKVEKQIYLLILAPDIAILITLFFSFQMRKWKAIVKRRQDSSPYPNPLTTEVQAHKHRHAVEVHLQRKQKSHISLFLANGNKRKVARTIASPHFF